MNQTETMEQEKFRDTLAIVNREGKRKWIYPKKPKGSLHRARAALSVLLLLFLFGAPCIRYNNEPFFLFNIIERKFIIFGAVFGPHDFFILLLAMLSVVVFIVLFTVVYGRVFCGWICPQTVFMEMVFRKVEYWIEGDASKQKLLNASPWNKKKALKKSLKHIIFFSLSFITANAFLAWIIGAGQLIKIISDPPQEHLAGLISITIFSLAFYGVFSWFREQACILVCPYGRLQGVLLDQNSIVIAYDYLRGEPRGKIRKAQNQEALGDCIDCSQCVEVCPTGIDIRNGTQLECVNCTACIDACNFVMNKTNRPKGLIRYASSNGIKEGTKFSFTPRIIGYSAVLVILIGALIYMTLTRSELDISILRTPGLLSQEQPDDKISNLYDIKVTNKTFKPMPLELKLKGIEGEIKIAGSQLSGSAQEITESKILIIIDEHKLHNVITPITLEVFAGGKKVNEFNTTFLGKVDDEERKHQNGD